MSDVCACPIGAMTHCEAGCGLHRQVSVRSLEAITQKFCFLVEFPSGCRDLAIYSFISGHAVEQGHCPAHFLFRYFDCLPAAGSSLRGRAGDNLVRTSSPYTRIFSGTLQSLAVGFLDCGSTRVVTTLACMVSIVSRGARGRRAGCWLEWLPGSWCKLELPDLGVALRSHHRAEVTSAFDRAAGWDAVTGLGRRSRTDLGSFESGHHGHQNPHWPLVCSSRRQQDQMLAVARRQVFGVRPMSL